MCLALVPWSRSPDCSSTACTGHTSKKHLSWIPRIPRWISHGGWVTPGCFLGDPRVTAGPWLFSGVAIFAVASAIASRTCHVSPPQHHGTTVQSQRSQGSQLAFVAAGDAWTCGSCTLAQLKETVLNLEQLGTAAWNILEQLQYLQCVRLKVHGPSCAERLDYDSSMTMMYWTINSVVKLLENEIAPRQKCQNMVFIGIVIVLWGIAQGAYRWQLTLRPPFRCWEGRYGLVDKTHPSCVRPGLNTRVQH